MTDSSNGFNPLHYRLGMTGPAKDEYRRIGVEAVDAGLGTNVKQAMRAIVARLRTDPAGFGEPLYRMTKLKMMIRCAAISPLFVEYGVPDTEPVIIIRKVRWLVDPAAK